MVTIYVNNSQEMRDIIDNASKNRMFSWNGRKIEFAQGTLGKIKADSLLKLKPYVNFKEQAVINLFPEEFHYFFLELLRWEQSNSKAWQGQFLGQSIAEFFIHSSAASWRERFSQIDFTQFHTMELTDSEIAMLASHSRAFNIAFILHRYIAAKIYTLEEKIGLMTYQGQKTAMGYGEGVFCILSERGDRTGLLLWEGDFSESGIPNFNKPPPPHIKEVYTYLDGNIQEISTYNPELGIRVTTYEVRCGANVKKSLRD